MLLVAMFTNRNAEPGRLWGSACSFICVVAGVLALTSLTTVAQAEVLESIAAVINGKALTCSEISQRASNLAKQLRQSGLPRLPSAEALWKRALDDRIVQALQMQEARKLKLKVSSKDVDQAIADIESKNNIPAGQLVKILEAKGMSVKRYRKTMHDRLLSSKLINIAVRAKLRVSEESMHEYYRKYLAKPAPIREVQLRQILITLPPDPTPTQVRAALKKIRKLRAEVVAGENFVHLASLYSDAPDAGQGGLMGWFMPGSLPPRLAGVLQLDTGKVTDVIRSPGGFHLLYVAAERWHKPKRGEAYDEIHSRHILLKIPSGADEETRKKIRTRAESIAEDMQGASDEDFATRAREISQGPSATKGGDLGWSKRGDMLPEFEQAAFRLKPGETSGIVETAFGLHIIRLIERRHVNPNAFEAHRDRIKEILLNLEMQNQLPRWIAALKAKASIKRKKCQL